MAFQKPVDSGAGLGHERQTRGRGFLPEGRGRDPSNQTENEAGTRTTEPRIGGGARARAPLLGPGLGLLFTMPFLEKEENSGLMLMKNETRLQILKNKEQRRRLVHEICTFLDSSQSVQEIDALRTENRKLKNANSRLRYKTKDWALKKEEYENEIERLSSEISNYLNVTNFWYQDTELLNDEYNNIPREQANNVSTQTEGALGPVKSISVRNVTTQTGEDDTRHTSEKHLSQDEYEQ
ncbi:uncharacterized protein LOC114043448 [Vombatus ursinus]|uniref:uncharacterized protein LOC114042953 n=1 Tax=Vombatus ursinus TaxID=29139 RepID=UPI000FFD4955|nr:uncharacterized protein LOC114042953 [Vombatus ursinus]XP_027718396.1 uncharacterized protein LOC114043448 [Vombatus ursinus]